MRLPKCNRPLYPLKHWGKLAGIAVASSCLLAAIPARSATTDYIVEVKDTEDGLPSSAVTSIAQTPEGYLWVGTYNGLTRYDGERFVTFGTVGGVDPINTRIRGLYTDVEGTLWINTYNGGLTSYRNGAFQNEWKSSARAFDQEAALAVSTSNLVTFVTPFGEVIQRRKSFGNILWRDYPPPEARRVIFQCADTDGRLWFISRDGKKILWFEEGKFKDFSTTGSLPANPRFTTIAPSKQGGVWIGAEGFIGQWNNNVVRDASPTNGPVPAPAMIHPTRKGDLWVLAGGQLRQLSDRRWTTEVSEWRGRLGSASGRSMGVHEDREGGIWFNHYGNGLFHIRPDGRQVRFTAAEGLPGERIGAWLQSHDGSIWCGVDRGGLVRLRTRRFQVIDKTQGLPAQAALSVCEDAHGQVWIGTYGGGLCRWHNGELQNFQIGSHISANFVFSVCPRQDGGVWLAAAEREDLYMLRDDRIEDAPGDIHGVKSILTDNSGRVWIGTKAGVTWFTDGDRRVFNTNNGIQVSAIRALSQGLEGKIWAGADDGTLYQCNYESATAFRAPDALAGQPIWSLLADSDGAVWAGTFRGGLLRFKDGKFSRISLKQGLPTEIVSQILEDKIGRLWLGTPQGVFYVSKSLLNRCADGQINHIDCGRLDGPPSLECADGYQPSCWRGIDGRLWFATTKGVVSVDPEELSTNSIPVPVLVEELSVDGGLIPLNTPRVTIKPGRKHYEFRYTALNFEDTRFRYKMEGFDHDWIEAGTKRTAQYSQLPAGEYRFRVIASDDKGIWDKTGATLTFTVQPQFYQRTWFIALASLLTFGTVVFVVRFAATRKYRRALAQLEQQHAIERDRARIAKDIHDDIGAGLTQISLLSELARRGNGETIHLDRISDSARGLTRAMDEIVWAINPQHDTLSGMMDYISAYTEDYLRTAGIRCRMNLPTALPDMPIEAELRYNLFLALKEALNNVVKHAHATEVRLKLELADDSFSLFVTDNGQGLKGANDTPAVSGDRIASGSGLTNLEKRLNPVGGYCKISSEPGLGTTVELTIRTKNRT